jgi:hypothetical protein
MDYSRKHGAKMDDNALKFAKYWRNCLADAARPKGALSPLDIETFIQCPEPKVGQGAILSGVALENCFITEADDVKYVAVSLRPCIFASSYEHGVKPTGVPDFVTPVITEALLTRDGKLWPTPKTQVPRDILDPLKSGSFAISTVSSVDKFISSEPPLPAPAWTVPDQHSAHWEKYQHYLERLLTSVFPGWPSENDNFCRSPDLLIIKEKHNGHSEFIMAVYDNIRSTSPQAALFERYAALDYEAPMPCLPTEEKFAERLAHSNDTYPLAKAQRDALTHLLATPAGGILAVNGPPGTGKTTLLLSVVATLWAKAALDEPDAPPPIIVACSTNNQAVTNILDAFATEFSSGSGPLAGRWLSEVKSFGAYLPSEKKEATTDLKNYQTEKFFARMETRHELTKATNQFLEKANAAFPKEAPQTVEHTVTLLRERIEDSAAQLKDMADTWAELSQARIALQQAIGTRSLADAMSDEKEKLLLHERDQITIRQRALERHLADESIFLALFNWIPAIASKRATRARLVMRDSALPPLSAERDTQMQSWRSVNDFESAISLWIEEATDALNAESLRLKSLDKMSEAVASKLAAWAHALEPLGADIAKRAVCVNLAECDPLADTALRFPISLLTTHYWEGRWLLETEKNLKQIMKSIGKTGRRAVIPRWQRWMKLTPCVVSTFHTLPKKLSVSRWVAKNDYDYDYLYEFADLLIVDEAGQALPEVAGASFALGRKALVIGDTEQIEPIRSTKVSVDQGNLMEAGLLPSTDAQAAYNHIGETGKSSASGSAMQIAQNASRYHYESTMARGMFLNEHRRCYDSIITYCNQLCYQGRLKLMRGEPKTQKLPTLGYLHVPGICQRGQGYSRHNLAEAVTIAAWVAEKRTGLEAQYGKDISQIVGIITPFSAQALDIQKACKALGIAAGHGNGDVTVGTVHSLQGAARPIVIFSPVYSKHADGGFIDQRKSMLNVAVSRAQDSFLVFGDMDLFTLATPDSPRAILARYLFQEPENELIFASQPRKDLQTAQTGLSHLHNAEEHDIFLLKTLEEVSREIHIVSPWLTMSRVMKIGAMHAMQHAVERGAKVVVYVDQKFNEKINLPDAILKFEAFGIKARIVKKVHSKLLMSDDNLLCVGSFNWFSACRAPGSEFTRHETSMVYRGPDVLDEIQANLKSLEKLIVDEI